MELVVFVFGAPFLFNLLLSCFGFTAAGVAAGSLAAAWQSSIGLVAAGSLFAWFQSLGAAGGVPFSWRLVGILLVVGAAAQIFPSIADGIAPLPQVTVYSAQV